MIRNAENESRQYLQRDQHLSYAKACGVTQFDSQKCYRTTPGRRGATEKKVVLQRDRKKIKGVYVCYENKETNARACGRDLEVACGCDIN